MKKLPYKIADINLAESGRKALALAEVEMPGVMYLKKIYGPRKPLQGVRLAGCLHVTAQTGVMIEALCEMGAQVSCLLPCICGSILSTHRQLHIRFSGALLILYQLKIMWQLH